MIETKLVTEV